MGGVQKNPATPITTTAKPVAPRGDAAKRALLRQDDAKLVQNQGQQAAQTQDVFQQAQTRPDMNPVVATRMSQSAEVAKTSVEELQRDDRAKEAKAPPPKGTATPPQFSYNTQLLKGLAKLKGAFAQTAEMLVGEKFNQGRRALGSIELTKKQSDTIARALTTQSSVIRTAFVSHALLAENGVVAKIKEKFEDNKDCTDLVSVACQIAASFGEA